jgi:hypothetical protein
LPAPAQAPACQFPGTWETRAPLPILATEVPAAIGTNVYGLGGFLPSGSSSNRLFIYDALRDDWSEGAPLPVAEGVDQVNIRVPPGVAPSPAMPVRVTHLGRTSNEVTIAVQ